MPWEHGDGGINPRQEGTLLSDEEIGMVPNGSSYIGKGLIVGVEHLHEIIKGAEEHLSVVSSPPEIAECKEKRKGNKEKKDRLC